MVIIKQKQSRIIHISRYDWNEKNNNNNIMCNFTANLLEFTSGWTLQIWENGLRLGAERGMHGRPMVLGERDRRWTKKIKIIK